MKQCLVPESPGLKGALRSPGVFGCWDSLAETYSEAQKKHRANASFQPANDPLSGMGIGLPVSRLYARHFGGDLGMLSLQGYG